MIHCDSLSDWRKLKEEELRAPHGWLTLVGLHDVPSRFSFKDRNFLVTKEDGKVLLKAEGEDVVEMELEKPLPIGVHDEIAIFIHRFGKDHVRVRDPNSHTRVHFAGMKWFEENDAWVKKGFWNATKREMDVDTDKNLSEKNEFSGFVSFEVENKQFKLWAEANEKEELFIVFKDATSKTGETYGAGRFLYAQVQKDNSVVLDFNRAYNPACAFSDFALCPLPGKEIGFLAFLCYFSPLRLLHLSIFFVFFKNQVHSEGQSFAISD